MADENENWFLLMDPWWEPAEDDELPPIESILGVWPLDNSGAIGSFRTNPDYRPLNTDSPTDPLDAVLRRMLAREAEPEQLQLLLRDTEFELAMNGDGRPLIIPAPDDVLCAVIATAEQHRARLFAPTWRRVVLQQLVELLEDEFDVLFNPGGPASVRLVGDFVRGALRMSDDEVEALYRMVADSDDGLDIIRWDIADSSAEGGEGAAATSSPSQ